MTEEQQNQIARCKLDILSARGAGQVDGVIWRGMLDKGYGAGCINAAFDELGPPKP